MQVDRLKWMAHDEARTPWVMKLRAKKNENPVEAEVLLRGALLIVARAVEATVSWTEVSRWAAELTHNNSDNFRGSLCHLPGWHTNSEEDTIERREDSAQQLFFNLARFVLGQKRPWWRHPRWHVWHWRLQVHPWQMLRRRLFDRCYHCGRRFAKNEPVLGKRPVNPRLASLDTPAFLNPMSVVNSDI